MSSIANKASVPAAAAATATPQNEPSELHPLSKEDAIAAISTDTFHPSMDENPEYEMAPGRVGIQWQCDKLYGSEIRPFPQFMALIKRRLGGPDPIDYCNAYTTKDGTGWHYISQGQSQLYTFEEGDSENFIQSVLGLTFEFTYRVRKAADEKQAPVWPFQVMQNFSRMAFKKPDAFYPGMIIDCDGPIYNVGGVKSTLEAYVVILDTEMPTYISPFGVEVDFFQLVGLTRRELDELKSFYHPMYAMKFVKELIAPIQKNPTLINDINRKCCWELDPTEANKILAELKADKRKAYEEWEAKHKAELEAEAKAEEEATKAKPKPNTRARAKAKK